jgi:putative endonuclease
MANDNHNVYIITNIGRTVLYTGVTNKLIQRLGEHRADALGARHTFTGRYNCYYLVYWECFRYIDKAIAREKQIKGWSRAKKEALINDFNPQWEFLNDEVGFTASSDFSPRSG